MSLFGITTKKFTPERKGNLPFNLSSQNYVPENKGETPFTNPSIPSFSVSWDSITGKPSCFPSCEAGTVTEITAGTGMNFTTITTSGSVAIDTTKVPYIAAGFSTGFLKYTGAAWAFDNTTYISAIALTGDVTGTYSAGNITTTIGANKVTNSMLRQSAALSVIGRSANTTGNVADITAVTNGVFLGTRSNTLSFLTINLSDLPTNVVSSISLTTDNVIFSTPVSFSVAAYNASGTLALKTQVANTVFAGPTTGADANPTFRALVANDIPSLATTKITSGLTNQSVVFWNSGFSENTLFNWVTANAYLRIGTSSNTRTSASGSQVAQILINGGVEFISVATASNTTLMNNTSTAMIYSTTYNAYGVGGGSAGSLVLAARGTNVNVGHYFTAGSGPLVIATFFTTSSNINYYVFGQALNSTYSNSSYFTINGTVNISSGGLVGAGVVISNSFTATANNQVLQGFFLNPTFASGGFTGLSYYIATFQAGGTTYLQLEGTTIAGTSVIPRLLIKSGNSTGTAKIGGYIDTYFTDAANSGSGETDLYSYTVKASELATNGDKIIGKYFGNTAANANNKTFKIYFGGSLIFTSGSLVANNVGWRIFLTIVRVSSSVIRYSIEYISSSGVMVGPSGAMELIGLVLTNTNILKITGQGTSSSDIVAKGGWLKWGAYTT